MKQEKTIITTPAFRLAFPEVFEARSFEEGKTPKFSITMLFPQDGSSLIPSLPGGGIRPLRVLAYQTLKLKFGPDKKTWPAAIRHIEPENGISPNAKDGWPIRSGDSVEWDGFAGMFFARASSKFQPGIVDAKLRTVMSQDQVFGGLICRANISAWANDDPKSPGVAFTLENLQILKDDGTLFGGKRQDASQAFEAFDDGSAPATSTTEDFD